jgi:LysM repeat protein
VYFASCEQTTIDGGVEVLDPPAPTIPPDERPPATEPLSTEVIGPLSSIPVTTVPSHDDPTSQVEQLYTVVIGDSLAGIAQAFGVDIDVLVAYNDWPEGINHPIYPGDEIRIPAGALFLGDLGTEHPPV